MDASGGSAALKAAMSRPASTGFRRKGSRRRRRASAVCATISHGWSTKRRPVYGVALPLVFDIDRARDVEAAEQAGFRSPEKAGA